MAYIITQIIVPNSNKSAKFIKNIVCLYKTLPGKFFNEQSNEYMDQVREICENYDVEDEGIAKNIKKNKHSSTSRIKTSFIFYCFIVTLFLITPFITVFTFKQECNNLISFLVNSTKRSYYVMAINHLCKETVIKDRYYFSQGEELRLLNDYFEKLQNLQTDLKNGKYGGKDSSGYSIFSELNNNPGCVRDQYTTNECEIRMFDNVYTEELANSPLSYIMVEYMNKVNDFINNIPKKTYDLTDQESIAELNQDIIDNEYFSLFSRLGDDIKGHINVMNDLGSEYLLHEANKYMQLTLIFHGICSVCIFSTFYVFVTRPIKKQLRVIDSITNITFSIPSSIYNSSPKLKSFIENGKLEE